MDTIKNDSNEISIENKTETSEKNVLNNISESSKLENLFEGDSFLMSKTIFRKLSKKYNKNLKTEVTEEELIDLIRQDLILKRQNSILVKEYFKTKFVFEIGYLLFAAFCLAIVYDYFVSATGKTGLFPAGVGSISRFLAIVSFGDNQSKVTSFFYVYQLLLNLPLMAFGFWKVGVKLTIYTVLFILFQMAFDQICTALPYVNPSHFSLIVNYRFIAGLSLSWNYAIWLFIVAIFGGALMGWTYSVVYKLGATTGGADFITIYFSRKNSKPVGTINRNVNFCLVSIIIVSNVIFLPTHELNSDIVLSQLQDVKMGDQFVNGKTYLEYFTDHNWGDIKLFNNDDYVWKFVSQYTGTDLYNNFVDDLPTGITILIKIEFVLGPSLFSSFLLFIMNGIVTNYFYPKYKLRSFMISTNKPKEVHEKIMELGFQNEVAAWDTTNRSRGNYLHRTMFMLSMSVMQWREVQKELFLVDPYMKVTIIRTKAVVGLFKYEPVQNSERQEILEKVNNDQVEVEKIKQIAIVKFKKQLDIANSTRSKLETQIMAGGEKRKRAEKEIERLNQKRDEMIFRFKSNINKIQNMDENTDSVTMEEKKKV